MTVFRAIETRTLIKPRALASRKTFFRRTGGLTAIDRSRPHLRYTVWTAVSVLALVTCARAAEPAPTPAPKPGSAIDGAIRSPIAEVPLPERSPENSPAPPARPVAPEPAPSADAVPAPPEPAPEPPASAAEALPEPAPAPPVAEPAPAPADTGPIGDPAPKRSIANLPLPRPAYDPPPRPPLDDQAVARREPAGPPPANPLMAERGCLFPPAVHADFEISPPVAAEDGCFIVNPVRLLSVGADPAIAFVEPPLVSCAFANALAGFLVEDAQPLALDLLESPIAEVGPGTSYACRGRNNDPDAKLSEHAFGNAFDLQAMKLVSGRFLTVVGGWNTAGTEREFWHTLQREACERFRTVLGPNADALHADHFHLDMAQRRNDYTLCQ